MLKVGTFYGVGVGPGDPELLTLKAINVIRGAGALAVPRSEAGSESVALAIVRKAVDIDSKELVELPFPMTKDPSALLASRRQAATLISKRLERGADVAFITLGDPLLFSTFSYLVPFVKELSPGSQVRSVPGVTSFSAAASRLALPLAETDERVIIIPAAYELQKVREAIGAAETIVLMKVNRAIDALIELLREAGLLERSTLVSRVGWPEEEVITDLAGLAGKRLDYFSTIIVKKKR